MKKILLLLLVLVVVGGTAFAFDINSFPSPIQKGNILISPTFGVGNYYYAGATLGLTVAVEYALPINFALTVGGEAGLAFTTSTYLGDYNKPLAIPIMAKAAWHPNFEVPNLDVYAHMKMGFAIGLLTNKYSDRYSGKSGFCIGFGVGARYFFSNSIGIFGDVGYENYNVGVKYSSPSGSYYNTSYTYWMRTYLRMGVTFKI